MDIETQSKIFRLRSILNQISDASFAYKTLYRQYPLTTITTQQQAEELLRAYEDIVKQVMSSINTEYGQQDTTA